MDNRKKIGNLGEDLVTKYLEYLGYKILERNFTCKLGEIDIIAEENNEIVFIEVKTRNVLSYGNPRDAVNIPKQKHIYRAAEYYLLIHNKLDYFTRIDVIEVYMKNKSYKIKHIKKAVMDRNFI